jgi:hypothetical protein
MDVAGNPEFEGEISAESADFTGYELLNPGLYSSASREVKTGRAVDKNQKPYIFAHIACTELIGEDGTPVTLARPLKTWIATFPKTRKNSPGSTSDVAAYLKAAGFEPSQLKGEDLLAALQESATYPVNVMIGWTNRTKKTGATLASGKDEYTEEFARTKDFNAGTEAEPHLVPTFEKDGEIVAAKHRIVYFKRV